MSEGHDTLLETAAAVQHSHADFFWHKYQGNGSTAGFTVSEFHVTDGRFGSCFLEAFLSLFH